MSFYEYMMIRYAGKEGRKSDLANDMEYDKTFPKSVTWQQADGKQAIRDYLKSCHACEACLEVFELCWKGYRQCARRNWKNASSAQ